MMKTQIYANTLKISLSGLSAHMTTPTLPTNQWCQTAYAKLTKSNSMDKTMEQLTKKQINAIKREAVEEFIKIILFGYESGLINQKSIKLDALQNTATYYNKSLEE